MEQLPLITPAVENAVVERIRRRLDEKAPEGSRCPCCDRMVKEYRRAMNADQARFLILLCREYLAHEPSTWIDVRRIDVRGGDYAKLIHWGLVENMENEDPAKRSSGMWRPTPKGLTFANGHSRQPSHVRLLDNKERGFSTTTVNIWQALGKKFNFSELWKGE